MQKGTPPRKPLTAFFMFKEKEKEKGVTMSGKEAGEKWKAQVILRRSHTWMLTRRLKEKYDNTWKKWKGSRWKIIFKEEGKPTSFKTSRSSCLWQKQERKGHVSDAYKA
jgi:hypothetical protein